MNAYTLRPPRPGARKARSRRRRGLSLFSVLMGLAVASVAIVGAVVLYNTTTENQNRNQAQTLIAALTIAIQQIHQGVSTYGGSTDNLVGLLATRNAIPGSARTAAGTIVHPFGGAVTVTGSGASPGDGRFIITFEDLEAATCAMLLDPYAGQTRAGGNLWGVKVGSRSAVVPPLTPANINTECSSITGTTTADVALTFE